jgi:hypothetical protein
MWHLYMQKDNNKQNLLYLLQYMFQNLDMDLDYMD